MTTETQSARLVLPVSERDHSQGPADAPVALLEYGDFECPHSGRARHIVRELQGRLGDRLHFVSRNFPLTEIHPHAHHAVEAAEAAAAQGRYWEMYEARFGHRKALDDASLADYDRQVGLDMAAFDAALATYAYAPRVQDDVRSGETSGVNGTPTFFINGVRHDGGYDVDTLLAAIERAEQSGGAEGEPATQEQPATGDGIAVTDNRARAISRWCRSARSSDATSAATTSTCRSSILSSVRGCSRRARRDRHARRTPPRGRCDPHQRKVP
ncbi:MAG: DsbA family protein [Dehalococcoidia bacterium]